ncbi:MAG: MotA/TolQ/ExbB proton channel family protein [Geminicoccales bacterium]
MRLESRGLARVDSEHLLLLKGLLLWIVVAFAVVVAWSYGLLQLVWTTDTTGISVGITLAFLVAAAQGSRHVLQLSRALNHLGAVQCAIARRGEVLQLPRILTKNVDLPKGCVADYIAGLHTKARLSGTRAVLDQALLLESFETELRQGHEFGWFVADLLLSLGLLGTVVGFIMMLGPIAALDATDHGAIRAALASMGGGMAVALYTTLTGLIGGMLLKIQSFLLDGAVRELIHRTTRLTEIYVLPAIERMRGDATV